jgi:hypothetical protein
MSVTRSNWGVQERMIKVLAWSLLSLSKRCAPLSRVLRTSIMRHLPIYASSYVLLCSSSSRPHVPPAPTIRPFLSLYNRVISLTSSLQHPFPSFGAHPQSAFVDAFTQIAVQVAADHSSIGVHVWDLGGALNRSLTFDRLHPTVQGHVAVGESLAGLMRPLVSGE